jgi:glycosyltransferase involved in cell wall biosynthesis
MKFSINLVTFNRKKNLSENLRSLFNATKEINSNFLFEVNIILNGDLSYIENYRSEFPEFDFIYIPQTTTADAKNFALSKSRGEYLIFLSENSILPIHYFSHFEKISNFDFISGPELTMLTQDKNLNAVGSVLSSPLCMGPAYGRHLYSPSSGILHEASIDLISPNNYWIKKSILENNSICFKSKLYKNEDYFLFNELLEANVKFDFNYELFIYRNCDFKIERILNSLIHANRIKVFTGLKNFNIDIFFYLLPFFYTINFFFFLSTFNFYSIALVSSYTACVLLYDILINLRLSLRYLLFHQLFLIAMGIGATQGIFLWVQSIYSKWRENSSFINESRTK